jgi:hypothetical protein
VFDARQKKAAAGVELNAVASANASEPLLQIAAPELEVVESSEIHQPGLSGWVPRGNAAGAKIGDGVAPTAQFAADGGVFVQGAPPRATLSLAGLGQARYA